MQIFLCVILTFCASAVKAIAKVLVKNLFDKKQKATLTSKERNLKGSRVANQLATTKGRLIK